MSKHTPGPWRTDLYDGTLVIDPDGVPVATTTGDYESADEYAVMEADALLIAAAPDLLEALIDLAGAGAEAWGEDRPCVRIARAAIAKAKGQP